MEPIIHPELLEILVCPETHQPVELAPEETVERLNRLREEGRLRNRGGGEPDQPLQGALIREDRAVAYPIIDGIPVMLIEEALPLDQVGA